MSIYRIEIKSKNPNKHILAKDTLIQLVNSINDNPDVDITIEQVYLKDPEITKKPKPPNNTKSDTFIYEVDPDNPPIITFNVKK